ncbi:SAF domain-containing protein [Spongiactinospora rosea]|uniref:SAF domain-containing protein n=1 Tax=Spongiactinospora rosea TaxID=2248750 RepID=UPI001314694D|nr:SAF domain-containing protein [Spongiactinospora rosea]
MALTGLGALIGWEVYAAATRHTPVLVMARDVSVGQVLQLQDLRTVSMGMDPGVARFDASDKPMVIGKRAAVGLKSGTLLAPSQVTDQVIPGPGEVVVPLALKPSQLPARGLRPGDQVTITVAADAGAQREVLYHHGRVDRVSPIDADGFVVVDVIVPAADGPALARQAAAGKTALVLRSAVG